MAYNYGRGTQTDFQNQSNIMQGYQNFMSGNQLGSPQGIGYTDPFGSYSGYQNFAQTGGYSPQDIANMRARGVAPIRAAYANAQQNIVRQRALQGGYSPNAIATQAKMAREQGQAMSDATQNVEAGLAQARNQGQLAGLSGMYGVEGQRLGANLDTSKFNAGAANQFALQRAQNQLGALQGMTSLYGTTPGMASTFGNQLNQSIATGGQFGNQLYGNDINNQRNPGAFDTTTGRINTIGNMAANAVYPWLNRQQQPQSPIAPGDPNYQPGGGMYVGPQQAGAQYPDYSDQYYGG
jgi:hypothetical protein